MSLLSNSDALQRFEIIWEHVECGICIVDAHTREILAINPVAARMFGAAPETIVGKRCHQFICPAEEHSCPIMDKGQVVDRSERKFVRANGETIPIVKSVAKIQYHGRLALLESFTDIAPLKEAEDKLRQMHVTQEASRAKSDFLSRMSHEMRTPMNAIIGMTKIAEKTDDVDKLKHCLSMIGVSSSHLLGLINDVLDMSKIEAGKLELDSAPLNIGQILGRACTLIDDRTGEKRQRLNVLIAPDMELDFVGDPLRLSQILTNLLSNAVKFTPEGGTIELTAEELRRGDATSTLRFKVIDSGIGMTSEQIGKLFKAFEQADSSISRKFGGTGLGLAISKNLVEQMHGEISVVSYPGAGSTFTVDVELARTEQQAAEALPQDFRIVLVSGDSGTTAQFSALVSRLGLQADIATSMEDAWDRLAAACSRGRPYDLCLLDHDLEGEGALAFAASLQPGEAHNMVLMTSFTRWSRVDEVAHAAGIRNFIAKPLFPSSLCDLIRQCEASGNAAGLSASRADASDTDLSHLQVLLVEDVDINQDIFIALLEETGIRIDVADNGLEALEALRAAPDKYDLVFMDVQMPQMDGYTATRAIRREPGVYGSPPIIAMTANVFKEDIDKCLECGMNDHLPKPIDDVQVLEKIVQYCR